MNPADPPVPSQLPSPVARFRVALVLGAAATLLIVVGVIFWYQDMRYSLPTPKPASLVPVAQGEAVSLPEGRWVRAADGRPLLLHFFNPHCPCSRFNADHVRELRERFGDRVRFIAVLQVEGGQSAAGADVDRLLGPGLETVIDRGGKIAAACGVYSTPQAVFLAADEQHTLLFRGNYNSSRYCADPQTEYVRLALEAWAHGEPPLPEPPGALVSYGCELPANLAALKNPEAKPGL
jgi:hypothetical protein